MLGTVLEPRRIHEERRGNPPRFEERRDRAHMMFVPIVERDRERAVGEVLGLQRQQVGQRDDFVGARETIQVRAEQIGRYVQIQLAGGPLLDAVIEKNAAAPPARRRT